MAFTALAFSKSLKASGSKKLIPKKTLASIPPRKENAMVNTSANPVITISFRQGGKAASIGSVIP